jgi:hypothetical protein
MCPVDKEAEARTVLSGIEGVVLLHEEEVTSQEHGVRISGMCSIAAMPVIVQILSEKNIAGFNRESMVLFGSL